MSTETDTAPPSEQSCPATDHAAAFWGDERAQAWLGLMETHARLVKALDAEMLARHDIGMSGYVTLARLSQADEGRLRMSELAVQSLLSPSRVSRLVDELAGRGLVERRSCEEDSRVVYAVITDRGRDLLEDAQETHFSHVEERLLGPLTESDVKALVRIWARLAEALPAAAR